MNKCRIGFIGYGNMAKAIARSFNDKDFIASVCAYDVNSGVEDDYADMCGSPQEVIDGSDYVLLSVKPQAAAKALEGLDFANVVIVSIMAGTSLDMVKTLCEGANRVVRVMPNLCARVGKSVNAYCYENLCDEEVLDVEALLGSFGLAVRLDQNFFDAITGLTGSSPAYTFRYAKALVECGVKHGLEFAQARDMSLYCIAACMDVLQSANSLDEMQTTIENVCSKGGTTIEGIYKLNEGRFDELVMSAVDAAIARSAELGKK